jgi:uncharacterized protein YebE (UPF0316 family)
MSIDIGIVIFIFVVQILYVSLLTVRLILMVKGLKYFAAGISVIEVSIHIVALSIVLSYIKESWIYIIVYAMSYAIGILVGSKIEESLALGYVTVEVITQNLESGIAEKLREKGYGVTSWAGFGMEGERLVLRVLTKRNSMRALMHEVKQIDDKAFVISHEPIFFQGGFWAKKID